MPPDPAAVRRALVIAIVLHLALFAGQAALLMRQLVRPGPPTSDFAVFYAGWSHLLANGADGLYDAAAQATAQQRVLEGGRFAGGLMGFLHPPPVALGFAPLAFLAARPASWLWTAALVVVAALLGRGLMDTHPDRLVRVAALTAFAAFPPVFTAIMLGQLSVFVAFALFAHARALERGHHLRAGGWLAVCGMKPHLLFFVLLLHVVRRRWRTLGVAVATWAAAALITTTVLGRSVWRDYATALPALERHFGNGTPMYMHNLRGIVTRAGLESQATAVAWGALALGLAAAAAWWMRSAAATSPHCQHAELATAVALGIVLSPHAFVQDLALVPVMVWHLARARRPSLPFPWGPWGAPWGAFVLSLPLWAALSEGIEGAFPGALPFMPLTGAVLVLAAMSLATGRTLARGNGEMAH
jgi:hypothetical protein